MGADYRSVNPFLLLSGPRFFDVGEKCQQQPRRLRKKQPERRPRGLDEKSAPWTINSDLLLHTRCFETPGKAIKRNSADKKIFCLRSSVECFITVIQSMDTIQLAAIHTQLHKSGFSLASSPSKGKISARF